MPRGPVILALATALLALAPSASAGEAPAPAGAATSPGRLSLAQLRARYGRPADRYADVGGVQVRYRDEGRGPVLLMVHGSVSSLETWDGVVEALKGRYRIVRYDVPPQGLSGPVSDAAAATLTPVDVAEGLLARLGVTRLAACVGVSSGGTLCAFLAAHRPELMERLVLSNMPADPVSTVHLRQPPALDAAIADAKAHGGLQSRAFWDAFLEFYSGDGRRIPAAVRDRYFDMNRREPEAHPIALVAQVADHARAVEAFGAVRAPVLLLWGGADPLLPAPAADALAGYLTGAKVDKVVMPDVGHYPPLEVPERYAAHLAAYLAAGRQDLSSSPSCCHPGLEPGPRTARATVAPGSRIGSAVRDDSFENAGADTLAAAATRSAR